jgi:hypothetical protein
MSCFDNYITINDSTTSRSGLYASDLPGIDTELLDGIARSTSDDHDDIWTTIYKRARRNLVSDVSKNLQSKFNVDYKLVNRETSKFTDNANSNSGLAGVTMEFTLSRYSKVHVTSIEVFSNASYSSNPIFKIYDTDENGELLDTITTAITPGRNVINIDTDYEADKVFISYNPAIYTFRQSENRFYATPYNYFDNVTCDFCFYGDEYRGVVVQVNGGGINAKYIVYCSSEKFVCENLKLFEDAFLYKIGYEITVERRLGNRLNEYTILTQERWEELEKFYKAQYEQDLMNSIKSQNISEDQVCYECKRIVDVETRIP